MSNIVLPKRDKEGKCYLSYSQAMLWEKSKREYVRQYMFSERNDNAGLQRYADFGSRCGGALETNDFSSFEPDEQKFLKTLPRYDEFETEIKLEMGDYYVLGFADSNTAPEDGYVKSLLDYKTGLIEKKKADYESDDYVQLDLYAAGFLQKFGRLPDNAMVVLIDRIGNGFAGEELKLTGKVELITKQITAERVAEVVAKIDGIAKEISSYYKAYLKLSLIKM